MESLKPLFEEIARAKGRLVLSLYFEQRRYATHQDMQNEQQKLKQQMEKYQLGALQEGGLAQKKHN